MKRILPGLLAVLLLAFPARGAQVAATLDREVIALGDTAALTVTIDGGNPADSPRFPAVPGIKFSAQGNQSETVLGPTGVRWKRTIIYGVEPTRIGEFTLGPISVTVDGRTLQAPAVYLRVVPPGDPAARRGDGLDEAAFLTLQLPQRPVYVGETFVAEIFLYAIGGRLQQAPQLLAEGFVLGKLQSAGQEGGIRTNNQVYSRVRFLQPLTAARAGDLTLQAANGVLRIAPPGRRPPFSSFFDDTFFGRGEERAIHLATPPAVLKVLPLPADNVPDSFQGAVGDFQLALTASPTNLQAGDPITLRVEIRGRGNFDAVQLPAQPAWKNFRVYPATASFDSEDPLGLTGVKRFEQVVTPETAGVRQLPPLAFSFFSPEARAYRTLLAAPVPLQVAAGAATPALPTPEGDAAPAEPAGPSLAGLMPHLGVLTPPSPPWALQPWFLVLTTAPWASWIALRLWVRRRERGLADIQARRRRELERQVDQGLAALAQLSRQGDVDAFFTTLFRVAQEMVAARLDVPPGSITEGVLDAPDAPRRIPPATLATLRSLFQASNQARYARTGGGALALDPLRQDAERAATELRGRA